MSKLGLADGCKRNYSEFCVVFTGDYLACHLSLLVPGRGSATDLSSMSMTHIPSLPTPSPKHHPIKDKQAQQTHRRRRPSSATSPHKMLMKKQKATVGTSKSSPTVGSSPRKEKKKPVTSDDSGLFLAPVDLNAEPGSADWHYSRLPLDMELARGLSGKWAGVEETYVGTLRRVFRLLRQEREEVCQYFYLRRSVHRCFAALPTFGVSYKLYFHGETYNYCTNQCTLLYGFGQL